VIGPNDIKLFTEKAINEVDPLKKSFVLSTEDQLRTRVKDLSVNDGDFPVLVSMLPSSNRGGHRDSTPFNNLLVFYVLTKVDYGQTSDAEELEIMQEMHLACLAFIDFLEAQADQGCNLLQNWEGRLGVDPEINLAGCNGYSILIETDD
tara:strand:- start:87525 stop:87971 length:447 start_codon:yes stop_codon:yes gene_type:complete